MSRLVLLCLLLAGCQAVDPGPPQRDCRLIVWARPQQSGTDALRLVGSWDDWAAPGVELREQDDGWQVAALELPPGEYGYLVVEAGEGRVDDYNPLTSFRLQGEQAIEVSRAVIEDCENPALSVEAVSLSSDALTVSARFLTARDGEPLDPDHIVAEGLQLDAAAAADGSIALSTAGLARGRHRFRLRAGDRSGAEAEASVSVFVDPIAPRWQDAILYQVVTDRFRGDGGAYLQAPATPAARAGGTLGGVEAAIDDGWFEALGVSALWLSPVYLNPDEARLGNDGRLYDSYHGYWVLDSRQVDPRIGGEQALRSLIAKAHEHGLAVILDVVPNHVYEDHPIVAEKFAAGWFNEHPDGCVCGTATCPWDLYIRNCWFAPYLPDFRLEHPDAMNFSVGEIAWWIDEYDVDGVRIDAVPMMPRAASRRIADALRRASAPGDDRILIGEVFTGGGADGVDGLRYYLGPQGLDSVFDFPLMWALRDLLAGGPTSFVTFDSLLDGIDKDLDGSGAVLGRMLGNHDTSRFVSAMVGDAGGDPWDQPASQPEDGEVFERAAVASTLQMTLPGMPVIYYGDELGLAGAGDPDCRRVMPDPATLSPARQALLSHARKLGTLRRQTPALRSSTRRTLAVGQDSYAYARLAEDGSAAIVIVSRSDGAQMVTLPGGVVPAGVYRDALGGAAVVDLGDAGASVEIGPWGSLLLLPE